MGSIFVNVTLFVVIIIFLSTGARDLGSGLQGAKAAGDDDTAWPCGHGCGRFVQNIMIRLIGSNSASTSDSTSADEWQGRLIFLQNEMARITKATLSDSQKKAELLEKHINQTESRLRAELVTLQRELEAAQFRRETKLVATMAELLEAVRNGYKTSVGKED